MRHQGRSFRSAPLSAHLSYLKREGVSRDGEKGVMFDAGSDRTEDLAFADRCKDDRHHFRFIVSPEDAGEMTDLKAFTRDLASQMEADLGTRLDWVAVDHWNTDNPHVHLLVRGVDERGADLVISRDYISRGLRSRAEDLVAIELGPKPEHEIRNVLEKEVTAERWTRLDVEIRGHADDVGAIDLRPDPSGAANPEIRRLMIGRLQHLEKMGLATSAGSGEWMVGMEAEPHLRDLGMRGDVIKTMHRAFTERGQDRSVADYVIDGGAGSPIIGRLVDKGLHDELTGEAYAVIDGIDGRAHHVRFRGIEAFEHTPPAGGIVEVRRFEGRRTSGQRWCSPSGLISICAARSPRRAPRGSTTVWWSVSRCRSPWVDLAARRATQCRPVPNISLTKGSVAARASASCSSAISSARCAAASWTPWARSCRPRLACLM